MYISIPSPLNGDPMARRCGPAHWGVPHPVHQNSDSANHTMLDADSPMLDAGIGFRLLNHLPRTRRRDRVVVILFPVVGSEGRFLPLPFGLRR
jgi:hypothetical protein